MLVLEPKAPAEVIFYEFDWAGKRLDPGEVILDSRWEVVSGSIVISDSIPPTEVEGVCRVYLEGGVLGETCIVTNWVMTNLNPRRDFSLKVKIKQK